MDYATRLLRGNKKNIVVASIEATDIVARRIEASITWTADPDYSDLMYLVRPITAHGIPRTLTRLYVGKHEYKRVNSLPECQATHKTWVHDRYTGTTWINPKVGTDLDTKVVSRRFKVWYSNVPCSYPDIDHPLPWICNDSDVATVERKVNDKTYGSGSYAGGDLKLLNGKKEWDIELALHSYFNAEVQVFHLIDLWGDKSTWSDKRLLYTAIIHDRDWDRRAVLFAMKNPAIKGKKSKTHKTTHTTEVTNGDPAEQDAKSNMNTNDEGLNERHLVGDAVGGSTVNDRWENAYPCVITDRGDTDGLGAEIRVSARHIDPENDDTQGNGTISKVIVQHANGVIEEIDGADWNPTGHNQGAAFVDHGDGTYAIDPEGDKFRILLDGLKDHDVGTDFPGKFTGNPGATIGDPLDVLRFYMCKRGEKHSRFDIASFTKIGETRPDSDGNLISGTYDPPAYYGGHRYHTGHKIDYDQMCNALEKACGVTVQTNPAGFRQAVQITNKVDLTAPILKASMLSRFGNHSSLDDTPSRVIVNCKHNQHTDSFKQKKSDKTVDVGPLGDIKTCYQDISQSAWEQDKEDIIDTMIANGTKGVAKANEEFNRWIYGPEHIPVTEIYGTCMDRLPGQQVFLTTDRAVGGSYELQPCWILSSKFNAFASTTEMELLKIPDEVAVWDYAGSEPAPAPPPDPTDYIFFDDFADLDVTDWTSSHMADWDASTGMLVGTTTAKREILSPAFAATSIATYELNVQINGTGFLYMQMWYVSGSNMVELRFDKAHSKLTLKQVSSGTRSKDSASFSITNDTTYNLKIIYNGATFRVLVDDVLQITMTPIATPSGGAVQLGVKSSAGTTIGRYEDVAVY